MNKRKWYPIILIGILGLTGLVQNTYAQNYKLQYKADTGDILRYKSSSESVRAMDRGDAIIETTTTRDYAFGLVAEEPGDLLNFVLTIEKIKIKTEGGWGNRDTDMSDYKDKRIRVQMTSMGEQKEITAIDSLPAPEQRGERRGGQRRGPRRRRNRAAQFGVGFFKLPDKEVGVGDSWTETTTDSIRPAMGGRGFSRNQIEERTSKYTILGEVKKKKMKCLHIKVEATYFREGSGAMGDNEMTSESDGETTMELWFAPKEGVLVELQYEDFNQGTTAISGDRGMTMSNAGETKRSLQLVKYKPKK